GIVRQNCFARACAAPCSALLSARLRHGRGPFRRPQAPPFKALCTPDLFPWRLYGPWAALARGISFALALQLKPRTSGQDSRLARPAHDGLAGIVGGCASRGDSADAV